MKTLVIILGIALSAGLFACTDIEKRNNANTGNNGLKVYAKEPNDSAFYKHLKYAFYRNKSGQLCERKFVSPRGENNNCNCLFEVYYDSNYSVNTGDTIFKEPLNAVVDINSFVWLDSTEYSKDRKNVYYFYGNSDGGNRAIIHKTDPASFKRLCEYRWGIDKNHVFYESRIVEGINMAEVQVLFSPDTANHFVDYIKDEQKVFFKNEIVPGADAKTFKVINEKEWEAEDKNFKYETGRRKE